MIYDLLVFTQYPNAYAPSRFLQEAKSLGISVQVIAYRKTLNTKKLPKAKFVILREPNPRPELFKLRDDILNFYISKNCKILNQESYLRWSVLNKKTQEKEFIKAKIPYVKSENYRELEYPFIAKAILGSHGDHVYKISNKKELNEVLEKYGKDNLIFQEFLKSGFDLRVIVIDSKPACRQAGWFVLGIMKRTPKKGNFLSNFSQGGSVAKLIINKEELKIIKQIAIKTAKHFKLDYVGVDIMLDNPPKGEAGDGEWKVLEVNRACQFKGFEKALKINVALTILKAFK